MAHFFGIREKLYSIGLNGMRTSLQTLLIGTAFCYKSNIF